MKRKSVEVEILGGLGNQLFGLAAGLYLARKTSTKLRLNLSQIGIGGTDHGKTIRDFQIPEDYFLEPRKISLKTTTFKRASNKLARELTVYKKIRDTVNGIYTAIELGFEQDFERLNEPKYIKGYFQTYVYSDSIKSELRKLLVLKSGSDWYFKKIEEIEKDPPIAIHMRRGDYIKLKDDFGVLDIQYYAGLISDLQKSSKRPIWIFTDSPQLVSEEIKDTILRDATIIEPPKESSPSESMLLISKCHTIVMSNSTFSWWASYLSAEGTSIYAPSKWFKGRNDPEKLVPPDWQRSLSIWQPTENKEGESN
jgi:Glycosyl transferase family 11